MPGNGFDVQLSGSLQPGDSFTVQPTPAGMADNGNIRALIDTRLGNPGFEGKFTREVTRVATNLSDTTALATAAQARSEEHTSELQSLMRISYAVFCLKKKKK